VAHLLLERQSVDRGAGLLRGLRRHGGPAAARFVAAAAGAQHRARHERDERGHAEPQAAAPHGIAPAPSSHPLIGVHTVDHRGWGR
jgi:hypothetical protein